MSGPERRTVRVRRRPRMGVFLVLGAVVGAIAALVVALSAHPDPAFPTPQVLGFLLLAFVPIGAGLSALVAIVLDALGPTRTAQAERDSAPLVEPRSARDPEPTDPVEEL
jgi:hypothetical protein